MTQITSMEPQEPVIMRSDHFISRSFISEIPQHDTRTRDADFTGLIVFLLPLGVGIEYGYCHIYERDTHAADACAVSPLVDTYTSRCFCQAVSLTHPPFATATLEESIELFFQFWTHVVCTCYWSNQMRKIVVLRFGQVHNAFPHERTCGNMIISVLYCLNGNLCRVIDDNPTHHAQGKRYVCAKKQYISYKRSCRCQPRLTTLIASVCPFKLPRCGITVFI